MTTQAFCPQCGIFIAAQIRCPQCGWLRPVRKAQPTLLWKTAIDCKAHTMFVMRDLVCLGTDEGDVLAYWPQGKRVLWSFRLDGANVSGPMAVWKHSLILSLQHSGLPGPQPLLAVSLANGQEVWRFPTSAFALSAPFVIENRIYFISSEGYLFALRAEDGKLIWQSEKIGSRWTPSCPALGSGKVFVGTEDRFILTFDAQTGKRSWTFTGDDDACFAAAPTWYSDKVFVASHNGNLYALNAQDGKIVWQQHFDAPLTTMPVIAGDLLLVGARDGHLYAVNHKSGKEAWEPFKAERWIQAKPTIDFENRVVYCTSHDHRLYALELETGREMGRFEAGRRIEVSPLLADGQVIFAAFDKQLYALQAYQTEVRHAPEVYERQKQYRDAAIEYAVRGDYRKAADLFEREQAWNEAAEIWKLHKDERRAASCYEKGGKLEAAYILYQRLNDIAQAARLAKGLRRHKEAAAYYLQIEQSEQAAEQFMQAGELQQAAKLYQELQLWEKAGHIYKQLGNRLTQAEMLLKQGKFADAAVLFEGEGKKLQAAQTYERVGEIRKAATLYESVGEWEKAGSLYETIDEWEKTAQTYKHLNNHRRTANAYKKAAEEAQKHQPMARKRIADLWEQAATMYDKVPDEGEALSCRKQVARYRGLPYLSLQIDTSKKFFIKKADVLEVIISNVGGSSAYKISIQVTAKVGQVQSHTEVMHGLEVDRTRIVNPSILPDTSGTVPLGFEMTYSDAQGKHYAYQTQVLIEVIGNEARERLDYYQPGLEKLKNLTTTKGRELINAFNTLEARLLENLEEERRVGLDASIQTNRARIMDSLNKFTQDNFGVSFNDLCRKS